MGYTFRELVLMRIEEVKREIELYEEQIQNDVPHIAEAKSKKKKYEEELEHLQQMV